MNAARAIHDPGLDPGLEPGLDPGFEPGFESRGDRGRSGDVGRSRIVRASPLGPRPFPVLLAGALLISLLVVGGCAPTFTLCEDGACDTFEESTSLQLDADTGAFDPPGRIILELRPLVTFVSGRRLPDPGLPPDGTPFEVWVGDVPAGLSLHADVDPEDAIDLDADLPPLRVGGRLVLRVVGTGAFDTPEEIEFIVYNRRYGFARATIPISPDPRR